MLEETVDILSWLLLCLFSCSFLNCSSRPWLYRSCYLLRNTVSSGTPPNDSLWRRFELLTPSSSFCLCSNILFCFIRQKVPYVWPLALASTASVFTGLRLPFFSACIVLRLFRLLVLSLAAWHGHWVPGCSVPCFMILIHVLFVALPLGEDISNPSRSL